VSSHRRSSGKPERPTRKKRKRRGKPEPAAEPQQQAEIATNEDVAEERDFASEELGIGSRMVPPDFGWSEPTDPGDSSALDDEPRLSSGGVPSADVAAQIRALEARLDGLIRKASNGDEQPPPSIREQVGSAAREVVERLAAPLDRDAGEETAASERERELLSSDYYKTQWGRLGLRRRAERVDDFGLDPENESRIRPLTEFLYKHWFRIETHGVDQIPNEGRCIVVANHSGTLPLDGMMLKTAVRLEHPAARELRWLAEDFIFYLPFVGVWMNRVGAVRACQENAERLLKKDALVAVFPEGVKGIKKLYSERYRLQRFGRGGFIRLCLRTQTPLVPAAIIGGEETSPMLYRVEYLSKALGLPYLPITPTFPALGPFGLLPAPTKWKIAFAEPMRFDGYGPEAADDHVLVGRLAERVRATIQSLLDQGVRSRKSVWFG
jgi:1-acyl-sn-glycerol-3-phosphate acyltransferase